MRLTIKNLEGVLEDIGGESLQQVSEKFAAFDATQLGYVQTLSAMLNAESVTLRAESSKHDQALRAARGLASAFPAAASG